LAISAEIGDTRAVVNGAASQPREITSVTPCAQHLAAISVWND